MRKNASGPKKMGVYLRKWSDLVHRFQSPIFAVWEVGVLPLALISKYVCVVSEFIAIGRLL